MALTAHAAGDGDVVQLADEVHDLLGGEIGAEPAAEMSLTDLQGLARKHDEEQLAAAGGHVKRMQQVAATTESRLRKKHTAVKRTTNHVSLLRNRLVEAKANAEQDRIESMAAASDAEKGAAAEQHKVLEAQELEDSLTDSEQNHFVEGVQMAHEIEMNDISRILPKNERTDRIAAKAAEVERRVDALAKRDGIQARKEAANTRAMDVKILQKEQSDALDAKAAMRRATGFKQSDSENVLQTKLKAALASERTEESSSIRGLRDELHQMEHKLTEAQSLKAHNKMMELKLKVMDEKLQNAILARRMGLDEDQETVHGATNSLRQSVANTGARLHAKSEEVASMSTEVASLREKLAKAQAEAQQEIAQSKSVADTAASAAEEQAAETMEAHAGGSLTKQELDDYQTGMQLMQQEQQYASGSEASDKVQPTDDSSEDLGESNEAAQPMQLFGGRLALQAKLGHELGSAVDPETDDKMEKLQREAARTEAKAQSAISTSQNMASDVADNMASGDLDNNDENVSKMRDALETVENGVNAPSTVASVTHMQHEVAKAAADESKRKQLELEIDKSKAVGELEVAKKQEELDRKKNAMASKLLELEKSAELAKLQAGLQAKVEEGKQAVAIEDAKHALEQEYAAKMEGEKQKVKEIKESILTTKENEGEQIAAMQHRLNTAEQTKEAEEFKVQAEVEAVKKSVRMEKQLVESQGRREQDKLNAASLKLSADRKDQQEASAELSALQQEIASLRSTAARAATAIIQKADHLKLLQNSRRDLDGRLAILKAKRQRARRASARDASKLTQAKRNLENAEETIKQGQANEAEVARLQASLSEVEGKNEALESEEAEVAKGKTSEINLLADDAKRAKEQTEKVQQALIKEDAKSGEELANARDAAAEALRSAKTEAAKEDAEASRLDSAAAEKVQVAKADAARELRDVKNKAIADITAEKNAAAAEETKQLAKIEAEESDAQAQAEEDQAAARNKAKVAQEKAEQSEAQAMDTEATMKRLVSQQIEAAKAKANEEFAKVKASIAEKELSMKEAAHEKIEEANKEAAAAKKEQEDAISKTKAMVNNARTKAEALAKQAISDIEASEKTEQAKAFNAATASSNEALVAAVTEKEQAEKKARDAAKVQEVNTAEAAKMGAEADTEKKKADIALAIEAAKLDDAKAKHPALMAKIKILRRQSEEMQATLAKTKADEQQMQEANHQYKQTVGDMEADIRTLTHKLTEVEASNASDDAQLKQLMTDTTAKREEISKLKEQVTILTASRQEMDDKAAALAEQQTALADATKNVESHLDSQQLATKEAQEAARLEALKNEAATAIDIANQAKASAEQAPMVTNTWSWS
jgi:hypothetical protein